jgi:hypothetical protein
LKASSTPDFRAGIEVRDIPDGAIVSGRVDSDEACAVTYKRGGRILAVASISRDLQSLEAERDLEQT